MDAAAVDDAFFPREGRGPNPAHQRPDITALVERRKKNRRLPVKHLRAEHCGQAAEEAKLSCSYQALATAARYVALEESSMREFFAKMRDEM